MLKTRKACILAGFGDVSFWRGFFRQIFQKLPIAKMEKCGYYGCGFR